MTMTNPPAPMVTVKNFMRSPEVDAFVGLDPCPLGMESFEPIPVNPEICFRWVNRIAGEGLRFAQCVYSGFEVAVPTDVKDCPKLWIKDGKIIRGDQILMKMSKKKYYAALKYNHNLSVQKADRMRIKENAQEIQSQTRSRAPNEIARKISTFVPSEAEVEKMIGDPNEFKVMPTK